MKKLKKPGKIAQAILSEVVPESREADSDEEDLTRAKVVGDEVSFSSISFIPLQAWANPGKCSQTTYNCGYPQVRKS